MAIASPTHQRSRRAMLTGAVGALGALAAGAIGRPALTRAADGEAVIQGAANNAGSLTTITNTTNADFGDAFRAVANGAGIGVTGTATSGWGVYGHATSGIGVRAASGTGKAVEATSTSSFAVDADSSGGVGVRARSTSNHAFNALSAQATAARIQTDSEFGAGLEVEVNHATNGRGAIEAYHKGNGPAVWATATNGYAVRGSGRLRFEKVSGVATISAGSTSKTVSPGVNVTSGSFVLLTPKANIGSRALWFTTDATNNRFTIRMSSSRASGTKVAWLLLG